MDNKHENTLETETKEIGFSYSPGYFISDYKNKLKFNLFSLQAPLSELRRSGQKQVGRRVQGGLYRILDHADDESDSQQPAWRCHSEIPKRGAGHRDQQQGAAGNTGSAAGRQGSQNTEDDGTRDIHVEYRG